MPLECSAKSVMASMVDQYGAKNGKRVFYATANAQDRKPETWKKESAVLKLAAVLVLNKQRKL